MPMSNRTVLAAHVAMRVVTRVATPVAEHVLRVPARAGLAQPVPMAATRQDIPATQPRPIGTQPRSPCTTIGKVMTNKDRARFLLLLKWTNNPLRPVALRGRTALPLLPRLHPRAIRPIAVTSRRYE